MTSKSRGFRRQNASQKKGNKVTQNNHASQDVGSAAATQISEYMKNINTQRAELINRRREAQAQIEQCDTGIAQCDGAMAAYQETLRLLTPAAPPAPPTLVPQPAPAAPPVTPVAASPTDPDWDTATSDQSQEG